MGGREGHQKSKNWTQKDTGEKGGGVQQFLTARFMNQIYPGHSLNNQSSLVANLYSVHRHSYPPIDPPVSI